MTISDFNDMKKLGILISVALIISLVVVYTIYNPENTPLFPQCSIKKYTGLDCPGCGTQRSIHALLNLELIAAFSFNPLLYMGLIYGAIYLLFFQKMSPSYRSILFGKTGALIWGAIIICFTVLRNLL